MTNPQHHLIHDLDRDGWGSAALLVCELGAERCHLHPTQSKDACSLISTVGAQPGDHVWLLDIPTPSSWSDVPSLPDVAITWVDHHPVRATDAPPSEVRLILPGHSEPTTTMHLLVRRGLVSSVATPMVFVRSLCVPAFETEWTRIFDGLGEAWDQISFMLCELPAVIAAAPRGEAPDQSMVVIGRTVQGQAAKVDRVLETARIELHAHVVIVYLADAFHVPLKHYGLRAQRKHDKPVSVIVHRSRRLYCGRNTRGAVKLDFLAHFAARGFAATGHPYVAFVDVPKARQAEELRALIAAVEEGR
ncbi:MAG: hypothetical protein MUC50_20560 [Myxococcota bacterium]|jgi:hypothetical protein|nr:hypothetical protein [Myxococcota bacterium]